MDKNSKMVLEKGEKLYDWGKSILKIWIAAWCLLLLISVIAMMIYGIEGIVDVLTFHVSSSYSFTMPIVALCYLCVSLGTFGPVLCLSGIHFIGLGQIGINTSARTAHVQEMVAVQEPIEEPVEEKKSEEKLGALTAADIAAGYWLCECGAKNKTMMCMDCGRPKK